MQENIQISAIIPTYNREHTIARAIDSVLGQKYAASEIIVVDDGSSDNTKKILEAYGENIRYVYQKNGGVSSARNRGVNEAKYKWIAFLDSDDYWLPHHLQDIVDVMKNTNCEAALYFSDAMFAPDDGRGSYWNFCRFKITDLFLFKNDASEWAFMNRQPMIIPSSVIRRQAYFEVGSLPENMLVAEDTLLFYKLVLKYPACAVRGCGTIVTSDGGSQRLTRTHDGYSIVFLNSKLSLYRELYFNESKISDKYRKILKEYLSESYFSLSRYYFRKRNYPMVLRNLYIGFRTCSSCIRQELFNRIKRSFSKREKLPNLQPSQQNQQPFLYKATLGRWF